jgi:hypothetical protein
MRVLSCRSAGEKQMQQICISQSYSTGTSTGSTTIVTLRKSNTQWNKIRGFSVDILELLNDRGGLIRFCRISRGNISKGVGLLNKGVKPMRKSPSLGISSKYNWFHRLPTSTFRLARFSGSSCGSSGLTLIQGFLFRLRRKTNT